MTNNRKELSTLVAQCDREIEALINANDHGQHDERIQKLSITRIKAVRRLQDIKRGA